jgi:hypothetical protein
MTLRKLLQLDFKAPPFLSIIQLGRNKVSHLTWVVMTKIWLSIVLLFFTINAHSDLFLDKTLAPADYRQEIAILESEIHSTIIHIGVPTLALMYDLDGLVEFGWSEYWTQERGTTMGGSLSCNRSGGYDYEVTRTDFQKLEGLLEIDACGFSGIQVSGTVSVTYDDSQWPRCSDCSDLSVQHTPPLIATFKNLNVSSSNGETYNYSGQMSCYGYYSSPAITASVEVPVLIPDSFSFTRYDYQVPLFGSEPLWEKDSLSRDASGQIRSFTNYVVHNCDFDNVIVSVGDSTHTINGLKFIVPDVFISPEDNEAFYTIGAGHRSRNQDINSGPWRNDRSLRDYFDHQEFGRLYFATSTSRRALQALRYVTVRGDDQDQILELEIVEQHNGYNYNIWDFDLNFDVIGIDVFTFETFPARSLIADTLGSWVKRTEEYSQYQCDDLYNCLLSDFFYIDSFGQLMVSDTDSDGIVDEVDIDDDNDGVNDLDDAFPLNASETEDTDSDGMGNNFDSDDDGDGTLDINDAFPLDSGETTDTDGDGIGDNADPGVRVSAGQTIELSIIGETLTSASGETLTIQSNATAASLNVTAVTPDGAGFITVWPCGVTRPNASSLNFVSGDVAPNGVIAPIGSNGSVCFYSSASTEVIVDVAGWFEGESFVGATPQRLVDTRDGTGGQQGQLVSNAPLVVQATNISATTATGVATTIPSVVTSVALNITVVNPAAAGFITVYPCDAPRPLASNVNYVADQVVANGVIAPVSASGEVCVYSQAATDVIVDLAGWFPGDAFTGATPTRLVDTRDGTGTPLAKLQPSGQLSVTVQGALLSVSGNAAQVPLDATAAALNVTVVNPESSGFVTVWPCSAARPIASNLNFTAGKVVANNVVAPIGGQGNVCFYSNVPTDLIVDISGYFTGESGNQFVGAAPKRFVDTRSSLGPAPQ